MPKKKKSRTKNKKSVKKKKTKIKKRKPVKNKKSKRKKSKLIKKSSNKIQENQELISNLNSLCDIEKLKNSNVIIWGAGDTGRELINKSSLLKYYNIKINFFIKKLEITNKNRRKKTLSRIPIFLLKHESAFAYSSGFSFLATINLHGCELLQDAAHRAASNNEFKISLSTLLFSKARGLHLFLINVFNLYFASAGLLIGIFKTYSNVIILNNYYYIFLKNIIYFFN